MASAKAEKPSKKKTSFKNPKSNTRKKKKQQPPTLNTHEKHKNKQIVKTDNEEYENNNNISGAAPASASQQLNFFLNEFQSANDVQLSSLELESIRETSFLELSQELGQDVESLGKLMKVAFGPSWKEVLCEGQLVEGKIEVGCPAVLILSTSALRAIELLRGMRSFTRECHAVKLFSKHMKVEEQLALLKHRVNFGSGTPSRVKKLIDIEALGLSRLAVVVLDIHPDVKGYSLLTLPQVRDEFWDLYKNYFHPRLLQGDLRICLFGPLPNGNELRGKRRKKVPDE